MTDPNNPYDPYRDNSGNPFNQDNSGYGYQQNPGYGYQENAGYQSHDIGPGVGQPGGELPPTSPVFAGPAPYRAMEPISIAFNRLNANFGAWVLFGIFSFLITIAGTWFSSPDMALDVNDPAAVDAYVEASATSSFVSFIVVILSMLLTIFLYRGAFEESDGRKPAIGDFFKISRWGSIIGIYVLVFIASFVIVIPGLLLVVAGGAMSISSPGAGVGLMFIGIFVMLAMLLAFVPIATMVPLSVIDGRTTVTKSFGFIWAAVKPVFWKVLGTLIVLALINFAGALLCGLGLIYTMPLYSIAVVVMYRQVIGGRRPVVQA